MSKESSDTDIEIKVEKLKKKYFTRKRLITDTSSKEDSPSKFHGANRDPEVQRDEKSPRSGCTYREMTCYNQALKELVMAVSSHRRRLPSSHSSDGSQNELSEEYTDSLEGTNILCTETDVTLPSNLVHTLSSEATDPASQGRSKGFGKQRHHPPPRLPRSPPGLGQVYQEMLQIYERLQEERLHQQQWAAELLEREQQVERRESLLLQHQSTIHQLRGVEAGSLSRMQALQEKHRQEIGQLNDALRERAKENRRLKANFDAIKEINDSMKKQLNDVNEQNGRLEQQARKVQARLENLQRKHEYTMAHRGRENNAPKGLDSKSSKQEKPLASSKAAKGPPNTATLKLLAVLLDWVLDGQGSGTGASGQGGAPTQTLSERCAQVLPLLAEKLRHASVSESSLVMPLLKLSYWALRQLDLHPQHTVLTSSLRRLGEEVSRGCAEPRVQGKSRTAPLYKSACLHTRLLSTLILLKTITQADILAQALEVLRADLLLEDGQALFLQYGALAAILAVLRGGSPGLLAPAVDILMQMAGESRLQGAFLEACGTEDFFRCVALLLRTPRLDLSVLEKVSILLQKLSAARKNKRLFEVFSLHLFLQEMYRTADPTQTFLCINLSSILFNLGMLTRS